MSAWATKDLEINAPLWPAILQSQPSAPSPSEVAGGAMGATTYYIKYTFTYANGGESAPSAEVSYGALANNVLVVGFPSSVPDGATGWNVYVSNTAGGGSGAEQLQTASPLALNGTAWTEPTSGLIAGVAPPTTTLLNSGKVDLQSVNSAFFAVEVGSFNGYGGSGSQTIGSTVQVQESANGTTWTSNATVPFATFPSASSVVTLEVLASQLGTGKRYARVQASSTIGGTGYQIPMAGVAIGYNLNLRTVQGLNDSSVASQQYVGP